VLLVAVSIAPFRTWEDADYDWGIAHGLEEKRCHGQDRHSQDGMGTGATESTAQFVLFR
jgi:hypothetical protein